MANREFWRELQWRNVSRGVAALAAARLFDFLIMGCQSDPRSAAFAKKTGLPTTTDAKALP
jgi:hypothetical protein